MHELSDSDMFLSLFFSYLKRDEERQFMINVLNKGIITDPDEAAKLAENIYNARKAANGQGDYLSGVMKGLNSSLNDN